MTFLQTLASKSVGKTGRVQMSHLWVETHFLSQRGTATDRASSTLTSDYFHWDSFGPLSFQTALWALTSCSFVWRMRLLQEWKDRWCCLNLFPIALEAWEIIWQDLRRLSRVDNPCFNKCFAAESPKRIPSRISASKFSWNPLANPILF